MYRPQTLQVLNRIARDTIFSDRVILLHRKKLAMLFFCVSFIVIYAALAHLDITRRELRKTTTTIPVTEVLMNDAMQYFYFGDYSKAVPKYLEILRLDPFNIRALKRLAKTYETMGEKKKAEAYYERIGQLVPDDMKTKEHLRKIKDDNRKN